MDEKVSKQNLNIVRDILEICMQLFINNNNKKLKKLCLIEFFQCNQPLSQFPLRQNLTLEWKNMVFHRKQNTGKGIFQILSLYWVCLTSQLHNDNRQNETMKLVLSRHIFCFSVINHFHSFHLGRTLKLCRMFALMLNMCTWNYEATLKTCIEILLADFLVHVTFNWVNTFSKPECIFYTIKHSTKFQGSA
jgi:hypothetical protein